jgi:hypothetical protein
MKAGRRGGLDARLERPEGRPTIFLSNESVALGIEPEGCMTPLFGMRRAGEVLDAHWVPSFRLPAAESKTGGLLGRIAGEFLCSPNFGPDCRIRGASVPPHGWTAHEEWRLERLGLSDEGDEAYCELSLESPSSELPLSWHRRVSVAKGQGAYYSLLSVRNRGSSALPICIAHHNTVGAPFLEDGCRISLSAERFAVPPEGTEFDSTGRLAMGAEFGDLTSAPLRKGGVADIGLVPGLVGSTDFVAGAVPRKLSLGWSCTVNPRLGLAYLCFFPGASALPEGEIALSFNDLWMQYGGRRFRPWAETEGGEDGTFCLGTENATGAFANGLGYSLSHPELLGLPTTVEIPAGGERRLCYGTALLELDRALLREGVRDIEAEGPSVVLRGKKSYQRVELEGNFARLRKSAGWPVRQGG